MLSEEISVLNKQKEDLLLQIAKYSLMLHDTLKSREGIENIIQEQRDLLLEGRESKKAVPISEIKQRSNIINQNRNKLTASKTTVNKLKALINECQTKFRLLEYALSKTDQETDGGEVAVFYGYERD